MRTNFYLSKLSERDIARLLDVLPQLSQVSLDLADEINTALGQEVQRRMKNDEPEEVPSGPEPLTINHIAWTDEEAVDALNAATALGRWARGKRIRAFANVVLQVTSCVVTNRLLGRAVDVKAAKFALQLRDMNRDMKFIAIP